MTFGLLAPNLSAAALSWLDTYEAGLKRAAKEKKDILISFVGSDWCDQCKKLDAALLSKESFATLAGENFVLVELDYPQLKPEVAERNEPVRAQYGIMGFPVLLLTDSEGLPYGELRMRPDWVAADYLKALADLDTNKMIRDEAWTEYESADDDVARTAALEKFLRAVPLPSVPAMYGKELELLRKASKDKSPLVTAFAKKDRVQKIQAELQSLMSQGLHSDAVALCDQYLANPLIDDGETQMALSFKYFALMEKKDFAEAIEAAKALQKVAPESPFAKQAISLQKKAEAALAASQVPPIAKNTNPEASVQEVKKKEGESPGVAKTQELMPQRSPQKKADHGKTLEALKATHQALAEAENALAQAKADLEAAQRSHDEAEKSHDEAHRAELKARPAGGTESPDESAPSEKKEETNSEQLGASQVDEFETRAEELRKQAEELRKKARELRKETVE